LTIIDLSAASGVGTGAGLSRPRSATLTRAGHGSLLLRDREHPQDRRAEQLGRRKAAANPSTAPTIALVRPGCAVAALRAA